MPLKFVFGPSGSGKSTYLYQHVIEESEKNPQENFIVLVPEQFTMQTQKDLVRMHPRHGIMNIDVLSFARLAYRVFEETGVKAAVIRYIGKSEYSFSVPQDVVTKEVHWYLMMADNYYSKPQKEEFFVDSGYYKYHEAYHLLKFSNEKQILEKAYQMYTELRKNKQWVKPQDNSNNGRS